MKLQTVTDPKHVPLPDHVEIGVRIWQMKLADARVLQTVAAKNSETVRNNYGLRNLSWTAEYAAEQYAYVRYLMGIDDYWLSTKQTILRRLEYKLTDAGDPAYSYAPPGWPQYRG